MAKTKQLRPGLKMNDRSAWTCFDLAKHTNKLPGWHCFLCLGDWEGFLYGTGVVHEDVQDAHTSITATVVSRARG